MNLGLAIFLSSLILGFIFLFHSTKDRWNWKKISKNSSITIFSLILIYSIYYFFYPSSSVLYNKPTQATMFWGIDLGDLKEDVIFKKGRPNEIDSLKSVWFYVKKYYNRENEYYKVVFRENRVTAVVYFGDYFTPYLFGRDFIRYNLQSIKDYLGEPSSVSSSDDGLERVYTFNSFNSVFYLKGNSVYGYGIYNPEFGTIKY